MAILPDDAGFGWGQTNTAYNTGASTPTSAAPYIKSMNGRDFMVTTDPYTGEEIYDYLGLTPTGGGGGGSSSADHYNEVSANTQAGLDEDKRQFDATQGLNEQKFAADEAERKRQAALDERNMALSQGNLDLAKQKQADANHWEEVGAAIQREQIAQQAQGQQLQFQASMAQVAQQKEDSDKRFQVGMAGATNDKQRNEIEARWNAEQAQIAKMEDETKRVLGGQANQINQFGAETDRAARMGTLALDNNKFIAEMARSPRDLPGLFMMQRGVAPDWQTIINGGTPGQGASLVPSDVMGAYKPVTNPVVFNGTPGNAAAAGVGANTAAGIAASQQANPFITGANTQQQAQPRPTGMLSQPAPATAAPVINHGEEISRPAPPEVFKYYNPQWAFMAKGGYTTATNIVAGDAPAQDPSAGGALPERIQNPTGAPLYIQPHPRTEQMMEQYGMRPRRQRGWQPGAEAPPPYNAWQAQERGIPMPDYSRPLMPQQPISMAGDHRVYSMPAPVTQAFLPAGADRDAIPPPQQAYSPPPATQPQQSMLISYGEGRPGPAMPPPSWVATDLSGQRQNGEQRFALGTDNSGVYAANGMAGSWINTSPNDYANSQNTPLPPALKALADYGYPISPSIYSSATGNIAPTLNVADAYRQRGGGTLFGLQTLNNMSPAEQEAQRGISEGVVGVPWNDLVEYVSRGTAGLKSAQQARAA